MLKILVIWFVSKMVIVKCMLVFVNIHKMSLLGEQNYLVRSFPELIFKLNMSYIFKLIYIYFILIFTIYL